MDVKARFDQYKTYAWAPEPSSQSFVSPAVGQAIRAAADQDLATKNFRKVSGKAPDMYLVYHVTSGENASSRDYTDWGFGSGYQSGSGYYTAWAGRPATFTLAERDKAGGLILDMVEVHRNQLVWRGVAVAGLAGQSASDTGKAAQAVHVLLSKFPPPTQPLQ